VAPCARSSSYNINVVRLSRIGCGKAGEIFRAVGRDPPKRAPTVRRLASIFRSERLNFYSSAIDARVKAPEDQPSMGLLLWKGKRTGWSPSTTS